MSNIVKLSKKSTQGSITGRDGYIVAKALAYAIEIIESLPEERQEASDREDMIAIRDAMFSAGLISTAKESARFRLFQERPAHWAEPFFGGEKPAA
jgi:hypothetical protein